MGTVVRVNSQRSEPPTLLLPVLHAPLHRGDIHGNLRMCVQMRGGVAGARLMTQGSMGTCTIVDLTSRS